MTGMMPGSGVPPADAINSLPDPDTVNCQELWYSTSRCQPRFDPAAANAMLAEIINLVNCSGLPYDCNRLDNLCVAVKNLVCDVMTGCIPCTFAPSSQACRVEQLVLEIGADGCQRIARYSAASSTLALWGSWTVFGTPYPPAGSVDLDKRPRDPSNLNSYYNIYDLYPDVIAGTIDESKLADNLIVQGDITVPCDMWIDIGVIATTAFRPTDGGPDGSTCAIVHRIDGNFYTGGGLVFGVGSFTNFDTNITANVNHFVTAGTHNIKFYVMSQNTLDCAQIQVNVNAAGISSCNVTIKTAIV